MTITQVPWRKVLLATFAANLWQALPALAAAQSLAEVSFAQSVAQSSFAQQGLLLAQTGMVKTMIGYALVILGILLGLIVVCRPADRNKVVKTRMKRVQD